jgi:hypothetical protein
MVWGNLLQAVQKWSDVQRSKAKEGGVRHVYTAATEDDENETNNRLQPPATYPLPAPTHCARGGRRIRKRIPTARFPGTTDRRQ